MARDDTRLKAEHLKKRAETALREGNYREAWHGYTEALELLPDKISRSKIYCNRSLAYLKALRYSEALDDAEGTASEAECDRMLWAVIQRLTREQLCQSILVIMEELLNQGVVERARVEAVTDGEMLEASFRLLALEHKGCPKPGPYYRWATCSLSGRVDAQAAVDALLEQHQQAGDSCKTQPEVDAQVAKAYLRLGEAYVAEREHPDRDCRRALEAFIRGLEFDPRSERLRELRTETEGELTGQEIKAVLGGLRKPEGNASDGCTPARLFRVDIALRYPQATHRGFGARARKALRAAVARAAGLTAPAVAFDGVRRLVQKESAAGIVVRVCAETGRDILAAQFLVTALKENPQELLGGEVLAKMLGQMDASALEAEIVDVTPARCENHDVSAGPDSADLSMVPAARPKLELEVPYRMYRLTRGDGGALERPDKHPFCMSRVFYDGVDRPEEAWAQLVDGSCRWRQTGSEVKLIALKVPADVPPRELAVSLEPFHIRVAHALSGEVYLEGDLERGIVPEESVWMHGGGTGEDGCLLLLRKMNLELLRRHWMHSEMWWPRLFTHHADIAWDDYEKDYSDLPAEVLAPHRAAEIARDAVRRVEAAEKDKREVLQARSLFGEG
ncbi:hypothetical protein COCSUDRAFT_63608 [Coccomyxa subellipsoidea C-169]|uniref:CS domain-containing protein n=1 Tax=Coccomyxa subellipsoidea (strain C-169) TaxID=574566 RepID=I0YXY3_COCSC|nr:hypothetical protein COCSUDRAFT_63608 [Coccomyxa subellipsoidea C-169]EIE23252.1 hypothetical protein COCSUDRAFT_63608 [Coccomyxa subellipsoidea C-169]|eukprot:XP_005647796.1 hypothetical protein COCSUDRAFT_63608 [Coccomyxa subellipsoidea C-169]